MLLRCFSCRRLRLLLIALGRRQKSELCQHVLGEAFHLIVRLFPAVPAASCGTCCVPATGSRIGALQRTSERFLVLCRARRQQPVRPAPQRVPRPLAAHPLSLRR